MQSPLIVQGDAQLQSARQVTGRSDVPGSQVPPPIPHHPDVEIGDLHSAASVHNERLLSAGKPIIEVVERKSVTKLMQPDVLQVERRIGQLLTEVCSRRYGRPRQGVSITRG